MRKTYAFISFPASTHKKILIDLILTRWNNIFNKLVKSHVIKQKKKVLFILKVP